MDLMTLYNNLLTKFGDPRNYWPQWCATEKSVEEREKIVIGMILVQRTSWHNANIALKALKNAKLLSITKISKLTNLEKLTKLIRPAGFFQSKPKRLFDICTYVQSSGGIKTLLKKDVTDVRGELLEIKGVGKETADTILLYALDKPVFIIDEYTYRFSEKYKLSDKRNYDDLQELFHKLLPKDVSLYQKFHALIIISQRGREKSMMEVV